MPKGPKGEKRPADVIGAAIMVAKIATGEIDDNPAKTKRSVGGKIGGKARAFVRCTAPEIGSWPCRGR
jgi:hypothetical protein